MTLRILARVVFALAGMCLGFGIGWVAASEIIIVFDWEHSQSLAGDVFSFIGLGMFVGTVAGLISGIALPPCLLHFRKRRALAPQAALPDNPEHTWPPAPQR